MFVRAEGESKLGAIPTNGKPIVKRLYYVDGTRVLAAENPAYPDMRSRRQRATNVFCAVRSVPNPIVSVECNSFYVDCERALRPGLRYRPATVLSDNETAFSYAVARLRGWESKCKYRGTGSARCLLVLFQRFGSMPTKAGRAAMPGR
ncbi:MAG: hypothetical protein ACU84J_08825 [Gammaproteobacteria bacterium]